MNNGRWLIWIIIGGSILQWVFTKVQEQAELNRAKKEREARRVGATGAGDRLEAEPVRRASVGRTSRPSNGGLADPRAPGAKPNDLQARRQAQLRVLRERQIQRPPAFPGPSRVPPARGAQTPFPSGAQGAGRGGKVPPHRTITIQTPTGAPSSSPPRNPARRPVRPGQTPAAPSRKQPAASRAPSSQPSTPQQVMEPRTENAASQGRRHASTLIPTTHEDWRRAIIASEILAPPVSMRENA